MHAHVYECVHLGMYVVRNIKVFMCMYACISVHSYACVHAYESSLLPCHYTCLISLNKNCHIVNMMHTAIMLNGHIDPTIFIYVPKYNQLQYLLHMLLPCMGQQQKCHSICHIYKLVHVYM